MVQQPVWCQSLFICRDHERTAVNKAISRGHLTAVRSRPLTPNVGFNHKPVLLRFAVNKAVVYFCVHTAHFYCLLFIVSLTIHILSHSNPLFYVFSITSIFYHTAIHCFMYFLWSQYFITQQSTVLCIFHNFNILSHSNPLFYVFSIISIFYHTAIHYFMYFP
jgi:hypothetical protein